MNNSKPKVDPNKLDQYGALLNNLSGLLGEISRTYNSLTDQEKTLVGCVVVQIINPWSGKHTWANVGGGMFIRNALDILINRFRNNSQEQTEGLVQSILSKVREDKLSD